MRGAAGVRRALDAACCSLIPLAVAVWVLRVGVDIADDGLTVRVAGRAAAGAVGASWPASGWPRGGDLWLVTTARHRGARLPVMRARDLPRLAALSGGRIERPGPPAGAQ